MDNYTQFVGIPLRNMHSPTEIVSMRVLREAIEFFKLYVSR
jgi:putative aminopeptidase FrvX